MIDSQKLKQLLLIAVVLFPLKATIAQYVSFPFDYPESYSSVLAKKAIVIDGDINDEAWKEQDWTSDFVNINGRQEEGATQRTRTKIAWDSKCLYIAAELEEAHIWAKNGKRDTDIFHENCFEVFIDISGDGHNYFEFQINANAVATDIYLPRPYRNYKRTDLGWDLHDTLYAVKVYGTVNDPSDIDEKWTVEIAFPWALFEEAIGDSILLGEVKQIRANFARVQWELDIKKGNYHRIEKGAKKHPSYYTWTPQGRVNLHQPETWGYLCLSESIGCACAEDSDFALKMAMYEIFMHQIMHLRKHKTVEADVDVFSIHQFNQEHFKDRITLEVEGEGFILLARGNQGLWKLDRYGQMLLVPNDQYTTKREVE